MKLPVLLATVVALVTASAANAASYAFSYLFGPVQFMGQLTGTLQGDGNTVFVDTVSNVFLNGSPVGPHPFVAAIPGFGGSNAVVTLNGSTMDISACTVVGDCTYGFVSSTDPTIILDFGSPVFGFYYPGMASPVPLEFDPAGWSMTPLNGAVPEPDSWVLLIAGFGLTGAVLRRRRVLQPAPARIRR